jgi:hypothetical protein
MTTTFYGIAVAASPAAIVLGLLWLADRQHRRRDGGRARQIELTDAIHRAMGAAAAPTVERRRGGGWLVRMTVPLDSPAMVATILRVTGQVFASSDRKDTLQIVLMPRPALPATTAGPSWSARHRPVPSAASIVAAAR